jgi:PAS domain S-box-containing protein
MENMASAWNQPVGMPVTERELPLKLKAGAPEETALAREQARADEGLRRSEERLQLACAAANVGIWEWEIKTGNVTWSSEHYAIWGITDPAYRPTAESVSQLVHPEDRARFWKKMQEALDQKAPYQNEFRIIWPDGQVRWVMSLGRAYYDASGQPERMLGVVRDVTERRQEEKALRESEKRLGTIVAATFEGISISENGRFVEVNEQLAQMLGFTREELIGTEVAESLSPEDRARVLENIIAGHESHIEHGMLRKDGTRVVFEAHGQTVELAGRRVRFTALRDITERRRAEEALLNQNRRLGLLNDAAAVLLLAEDPEGALAGIYGRIAEYFRTSGFFEFELNESGDELRLSSCLALGEQPRECGMARMKMGEGIVGLVARRRVAMYLGHVQQSEHPNAQVIKGLGIRAYACYPLLVGQRLVGTLSFASRERDTFEPQDQELFETLASYLAMAKERQRLSGELRQYAQVLELTVAERTTKLREMVAELEHMSYTIVHDMRAPLRAIHGFSTIIEKEEGARLSPRSRELFENIMTSAHRMDLMITDALNYNRAVRQELPLEPVDPGALLRNLLNSSPEFQSPQAAVRLEGEFPLVLANQAGLTQCFSNLLANAVKFVAPGTLPRVHIRAETVPSDKSKAPSPEAEQAAPNLQHAPPASPSVTGYHAAAAGNRVRLWFEDNGIGLPAGGERQIFDMFRRMHGPQYEGTGIGLALVRKVMERMGGRVGVESEQDKGCRFWLELQAATPAK